LLDGFTVILEDRKVVLEHDLSSRSRPDRKHVLRLLRSRYKSLRFVVKHDTLQIRTRIDSQASTRVDYCRRYSLIRQVVGDIKTVIKTALRERDINTARQHPKRRKHRKLPQATSPKYPLTFIPAS
jgi:hypothetical protein